MEEITLGNIWAVAAWVAAAVVLLANAGEKITKTIRAAKAPNAAQDGRLDALEAWKKEEEAADLQRRVKELEEGLGMAKRLLAKDKQELDAIHDGMRVSHLAQLALLDHALAGNNIDQMQDAKTALQKYLANK